MASTSSVGSGIDFGTLTDSIVAARSRPISLLQAKSSSLSRRSDALKQLNAKLAIVTDAAQGLTDQTLGTGRAASSSNTATATVTTTSTAGTGSFSLTVTRLASSLTQASRIYASADTAILAGGATTATFELRKGGASSGTAITIDSTNNTLEGLRDAINESDAGLTATIVDTDGTGTKNKLVLNSAATGTAGRVELVETTATGTGADIALASTNPSGATVDFSALDAAFSLNGLALSRSSNTVEDVVTGVTLKLTGTGSSTVSVTGDTNDIESKVRTFVNAYNDAQAFINGQYTKDASGGLSGVLVGDQTLLSAQRQLREVIGRKSTNNGGALDNLTQIGIGRDENGKLKLDNAALSEKLRNSLSDVRALLAGKAETQTGIGNQIYDTLNKLSDSTTGLVQAAVTGYQASIKSISKSVSSQLERISNLKSSLTRQFAAVDAAINQLNGQNSTLTNILDAFNNSSKNK